MGRTTLNVSYRCSEKEHERITRLAGHAGLTTADITRIAIEKVYGHLLPRVNNPDGNFFEELNALTHSYNVDAIIQRILAEGE